MELTAKLVMSLRDKTLLPMMMCKEALTATIANHNGSVDSWLDAAIEHLRKKGISAVKGAGRKATSGGIGLSITKNNGALVMLGCQTDFVSNSDMFKGLAQWFAVAYAVFGKVENGLTTLPEDVKIQNSSASELITEKSNQFGETINIALASKVSGDVVVGYNHDGKLAALVAGTGDEQKLRNVALHIVSANPPPIALNRQAVDQKLIDMEKRIIESLPDVQSKPEAMKEKIITGKLGRFFKEKVLLEQEIMFDGEKKETVEQYLKRNNLTITDYVRHDISILNELNENK